MLTARKHIVTSKCYSIKLVPRYETKYYCESTGYCVYAPWFVEPITITRITQQSIVSFSFKWDRSLHCKIWHVAAVKEQKCFCFFPLFEWQPLPSLTVSLCAFCFVASQSLQDAAPKQLILIFKLSSEQL